MRTERPERTSRRRRARAAWAATLVALVAVTLFPVSTAWLRLAVLVLLVATIAGLAAPCWRRRALRAVVVGSTLLVVAFLALPARPPPRDGVLEAYVVAALKRYEGVRYVWGGEGPLGIDCSGLMRRGVIDALFLRGVRSLDPGLVRAALRHWWHDASAKALRDGHGELTLVVQDSPSVNVLSHELLRAGDMAVTADGVHVMALVGEGTWIEADPIVGRVIQVQAPATDNVWFTRPVRVVRWRALDRRDDPPEPWRGAGTARHRKAPRP